MEKDQRPKPIYFRDNEGKVICNYTPGDNPEPAYALLREARETNRLSRVRFLVAQEALMNQGLKIEEGTHSFVEDLDSPEVLGILMDGRGSLERLVKAILRDKTKEI